MKNSQKGFANIILVVVIVAVVAVGGYFVLSKKSTTPTETQQTQTSDNGQGGNQINIPSNGAVIDTKKLSLYKIESCGFEVSFPSQFLNWNRPKDPNPKQCPNSTPLEKQVDALSLKSRADCDINGAGEAPAGCNFFEIVVANNKITGPAVENISVDNIPAEKLTMIDGGVGQILIQFEKNKLWYRYTHTFSPSDVKEAKKLSDLIISTFKFVSSGQVTSAGHIEAFENAINKADFTNASKYFADKVYVALEGASCCGEVTASRARQELEGISGLVFTFNPNDAVVKEYIASVASDYPNRRLMKNSPKLYFDEYIIGVESNVSQNNKAAIGYKVSNGKITDLFINKGRDR